MKRAFWDTLVAWKEASPRKPMVVQGARQVGKTWILEVFGQAHFDSCVLLDFAEDPALKGLFEANLKPRRILTDLSVYLGRDISLDETLLVFDEIQLCPEALTSLKYFYQEFPEAYICATGSLLGLGLSEQNFPVGKVQREWLRPMSFFEFLEAAGEASLCQALGQAAETHSSISLPIHSKSFGLFKEYMITGGMPEVVGRYFSLRDTRVEAYETVRLLQRELVDSYLDDIAKHCGSLNAVKIAALFKNIPQQLAREVKGGRKFLFKDVVVGRSSYDVLEAPIEWLVKAGLVHRVSICRKVKFPLSAYTASNAFMLYLFDTGILGAMLHLDPVTIHRYDFGQFKGFLAENAVLNELLSSGLGPVHTWREKTAEVEFLMAIGGEAVPIEVKSGANTKAKSLQVFRRTYQPQLAVLLTGLGANQVDDGLVHAPIYLAAPTLSKLNSAAKVP